MNTSRKKRTSKAIALIASLTLIFGLLPLTALAANGDERVTVPFRAGSSQSNSKQAKTVSHDPYDHAKFSRVTQEYGSNTVYIQCESEQQSSTGDTQMCQFHEWPLLVLDRPDAYYDGQPKEAYFYWREMQDYPNGKTTQGFPHDFAEWDGTFTYTGINGTVEYGPTNEAPIGEGTYYVYATVRIPSAVTVLSDATFILGKTFTIEPSSYKVKFDANVPNSASTKLNPNTSMPEMYFKSRVETQPLPPNQFDLPGYKFDHWNTKEDDSGVRYENNAYVKDLSYAGKDVTLYAQWKPKTYEITYDPGGASGSSVPVQAVFDKPGTLKPLSEMGWTYENHRFLGWKVEGLPLLLEDEEDFVNLCGKITAYGGNPDNVTLTAQWVENGQIVAVVTKDGEPQEGLDGGFSLKASDGTTFSMPVKYEDDKYVFDPSQAATHGGTPSALSPGEYDLYFKIEPIPDSPGIPGSQGYPETSAHITYGGTSAASVVFDYYTVSIVKDPGSNGVRYLVASENGGVDLNALPGELRARALDGAKIQLQTTVWSGYHFDGYSAVGVAPSWDEDDPMKATQEITVHGQATIMAHGAINTYAVRFDANTKAAVMGEMEDQDMVYGEPQNLFANQFIRADATFTGWNTKADGMGTAYADKAEVGNLTEENGKVVTLYAQWKETPAKSALLTFNLDGGTLVGKTGSITVSVNVGDEVKIPAAPTREGYAFKYWKGSQFNPGDKYTVEGDHTFTAVWEETPVPVKKATLTFDLAGGTLDGKTGTVTVEANVGDTIKLPGAPTRDGYAFKCWKGSEYAAGAEYKVEGDHTFTAVWEEAPVPVKPSYRIASGDGSAYVEGSGAPMVFKFVRSVNPETAFDHFIGIEVDGEAVPQEDGSGRMNWTARSGSVIVELQPSYLATLPAGAHTIAALFDDGDPASADFKVSPAPAPATHTVTFDANGHGKAPDAQEVEHGKKAKRPANPTADGYTFGGWYKDEACKEAYDFSAPVTENVTLYAKWTKKSSSGSGTSPKTGDPLAGAFAAALALAAASALALAFSRRRSRD